jgi:hypothetical protein
MLKKLSFPWQAHYFSIEQFYDGIIFNTIIFFIKTVVTFCCTYLNAKQAKMAAYCFDDTKVIRVGKPRQENTRYDL